MALEKLRRAEREKELLGARLAQLKAENEASMAECDLLRQKAKQLEVSKLVSGHQGRSLLMPMCQCAKIERLPCILFTLESIFSYFSGHRWMEHITFEMINCTFFIALTETFDTEVCEQCMN